MSEKGSSDRKASRPTGGDSINNLLPQGFESLLPFVDQWGGLQSQTDRYLKRQASTMDELRRFHGASAPLLEKVFAHLDRFPFDENLPDKEGRLFRLMLGLIEAAQAVEIFKTPRVPHTPYPHTNFTVEEMS